MRIWFVTILSLTVIGCSSGGGGGESSSVSGCSSPDVTSYFDTPGDILSYRDTFDATYSNGSRATAVFEIKHNYGEVSSIPAKYSYSGDIAGPYTLNVKTEDCEIDGFVYESSLGDDIIDDDLTTFKTIDAQTKTGSSEPADIASIALGDEYTFSEDSALFDSGSGLQVGNEVSNGTLVVLSFEEVTVPAGTYNAVKISFNSSGSTTLDGITDTANATGFGWFSVDQGLLLKLDLTLDLTLTESGLTANATSERVLTGYDSAIGKSAQLAVSAVSSDITLPSKLLINSIKQSLLDIRGK